MLRCWLGAQPLSSIARWHHYFSRVACTAHGAVVCVWHSMAFHLVLRCFVCMWHSMAGGGVGTSNSGHQQEAEEPQGTYREVLDLLIGQLKQLLAHGSS